MTDEEVAEYRAKLEAAYASKKPIELENDNRDCAVVLMETLLSNAKEEVCMLCHKLAREVFGSDHMVQVLNAAYERNPGLKFKVFLRNAAPEFSVFVTALLMHGAEIVTNVKTDLADMAIVDSENGRVETNANERKGRAFFHNREQGEKHVTALKALA